MLTPPVLAGFAVCPNALVALAKMNALVQCEKSLFMDVFTAVQRDLFGCATVCMIAVGLASDGMSLASKDVLVGKTCRWRSITRGLRSNRGSHIVPRRR